MNATRTRAACFDSVQAEMIERLFSPNAGQQNPRRERKERRPEPQQERSPEWMPDFSLDRQVAQARREMGEARWNQLMKEWD
jgi:hypothetical protein